MTKVVVALLLAGVALIAVELGLGALSEPTPKIALRAGMLRAVDEAEQRGDVPAFLAPALRGLVRRLPLEQLIRGGVSLRDLLG